MTICKVSSTLPYIIVQLCNLLVTLKQRQVVKVIWRKTASPPLTDGPIVFAKWCQYAFPCGHIGATWRIRLKLLKLCTLAPPAEYDWTRASFSPSKSTIQTANRSVQLFLHSSWQEVPILYIKLPLLMGRSKPHLINHFLHHSEPTIQTASRLLQPFLPNVTRSRSLYAIARSSVVCNVRAPYSGGSNFRQYFYGIRYLGHPFTSTENFTEIIPGKPLRLGS